MGEMPAPSPRSGSITEAGRTKRQRAAALQDAGARHRRATPVTQFLVCRTLTKPAMVGRTLLRSRCDILGPTASDCGRGFSEIPDRRSFHNTRLAARREIPTNEDVGGLMSRTGAVHGEPTPHMAKARPEAGAPGVGSHTEEELGIGVLPWKPVCIFRLEPGGNGGRKTPCLMVSRLIKKRGTPSSLRSAYSTRSWGGTFPRGCCGTGQWWFTCGARRMRR